MQLSLPGRTGGGAIQQLDALQNVLDQSFLAASYKGSGRSQLEQKVSADLYGVVVSYVLTQSQVAATTPSGVISNLFIQQTFNQMKVIAREAHVTPADHDLIVADEQAIIRDLGPAPNMNLGSAAPRDPLTVYYDSQVASFVHKR